MKKCILAGALMALAFTASLKALNVSSDFSTNPFTSGWSFGVGSNANGQFTWNQPTNSLRVHVDSSLPTVRLDLPIGATLSTATDFTLSCRFSFTVTSAPNNEFMQFAFGLVNHGLTGGNRTGLPSDPFYPEPGSSNVFSTVEFSYYPNVSPTYGFGRTLTPAVFGAQSGGGDAFGNFATLYDDDSDLGDGKQAIDQLPQATVLIATLNYVAATKLLTLTVQDSSLAILDTGVPALDLSFISPSFALDSLAIMAYQDGYNSFYPSTPALIGDMDIQQIAVTSPVPEPAGTVLLLSAAGMLLLRRRRA
jgi:hypothetical protein